LKNINKNREERRKQLKNIKENREEKRKQLKKKQK